MLAAAAALEYVFPPFPGDTITLFGAVLITAYGWSFGGVFAAMMAGSLVGMILNLWVGTRIRRRVGKEGEAEAAASDRVRKRRRALRRAVAKFERHGALYLVINRFIPAARALVFVAAGMSGMRWRVALLLGMVSAAAWNLLLIGIGVAIGANWETMLAWLHTYNRIALAAGAVIVVAVAIVYVVARRRRR